MPYIAMHWVVFYCNAFMKVYFTAHCSRLHCIVLHFFLIPYWVLFSVFISELIKIISFTSLDLSSRIQEGFTSSFPFSYWIPVHARLLLCIILSRSCGRWLSPMARAIRKNLPCHRLDINQDIPAFIVLSFNAQDIFCRIFPSSLIWFFEIVTTGKTVIVRATIYQFE